MNKITIYIMILTIFVKIIGFFREITLAYFYGATNISDAYITAITIPSMIFGFVITGISSSYIPMYNKIEVSSDKEDADIFTSNLISLILLLSTIIIFFCSIFADNIIRLIASGFDNKTLIITSDFTKISLFSIYFISLVSIFSGYLQIKGIFIPTILIGIPLNIVNIISIILSHYIKINILPIGFVVSSFIQILFLFPFIIISKYKYKININIFDRNIINVIYISIPAMLGVSVNQINVLVDRTIASQIIEGGISSLNYANKLNLFVQGIFVTSISTVVYPQISKLAIENNIEDFKNMLMDVIIYISFFIIPITVITMLYSKNIVSILFGRGAFNRVAIENTSKSLYFYSIGMLGYGLREVLSRAFYSFQDSKTPMINAGVGMSINVILNFILSQYLGISGLALATSISATFTTFLLYKNLKYKIGKFEFNKLLKPLFKIGFVSCIIGYISINIFNFFIKLLNELNALFITGVLTIIIYIFIIINVKIKQFDKLLNLIKNK